MPNDAKLGLVVGVGLVIAVAVVYTRKDASEVEPPPGETAAVMTSPAAAPVPVRSGHRPTRAQPVAYRDETPAARRHTVAEGESLFSLAEQYYGSKDRFTDLYQANRDVLTAPDPLMPGTVLAIPELPSAAAAPEAPDPLSTLPR